jgi:hypothetical protein
MYVLTSPSSFTHLFLPSTCSHSTSTHTTRLISGLSFTFFLFLPCPYPSLPTCHLCMCLPALLCPSFSPLNMFSSSKNERVQPALSWACLLLSCSSSLFILLCPPALSVCVYSFTHLFLPSTCSHPARMNAYNLPCLGLVFRFLPLPRSLSVTCTLHVTRLGYWWWRAGFFVSDWAMVCRAFV